MNYPYLFVSKIVAPFEYLFKPFGSPVILFVILILSGYTSHGQCVSLTTLGSAATQNFNALSNTAGSTTNNLTITGWFMTETGGGARDNEQYAVDTGASNTGDTYSYGAAGSTERAFGSLRSGTLITSFGSCFTNNTGSTITSLSISYTGEEWRLGTAARTDQMDFQYSLNATDLTTGTWIDVNALDFITPNTATVGAKDGNAVGNKTDLTANISGLSIPNGATFWIRWNDTDASGADDGLAVDDFSLTANGLTAAGQALSFDGVDDIVTAPLPNLFNDLAANDFTIETWVNLNNQVGSTKRFMTAQQNGSNFTSILFNANNAVFFYVYSGGNFYSASAPSISASQWIHIAFRWIAATQSVRIYYDGVLQPTVGGGTSSIPPGNNSFMLGNGTSLSQFFNGQIDDFRIWSKALSTNEINCRMNCEVQGPTTDLVMNYHFNQGTAGGNNATETTLIDELGNDGTLQNFALSGSTSNWVEPGSVASGLECTVPVLTYYQDLDMDGFGNPAVSVSDCTPQMGYVLNNTDCNDNSALEQPGQTWYKDTDNDNYAETGAATITQCARPVGYKVASELLSTTGDCNDSNAAINPDATEVCDGIDNNCNTMTDEGVQTTYFQDLDGDGFGNPAVSQDLCDPQGGYVPDNTDCNDNNALEQPGQTWYKDLDNDGLTDNVTLVQCLRPTDYKAESELISLTIDCDDTNPNLPGLETIIDTLAIQDFELMPMIPVWPFTGPVIYNSGFTSSGAAPPNSPIGIEGSRAWETTTNSGGLVLEFDNITIPPGYDSIKFQFRLAALNLNGSTGGPDDLDYVLAEISTDGGVNYYPRLRIRGAVNNNCFWGYDATGIASVNYLPQTEVVFQPIESGLATTLGYSLCEISFPGNISQVRIKITARSSSSSDTWMIDNVILTGENIGQDADCDGFASTVDCDDTNPLINPGATETCDGIDNNCNLMTDEGVQTTFYADTDNDGFGDPDAHTLACTPPAGYVLDNSDCNDDDPIENPGQVWYKDADGDGYSDGTFLTQCLRPTDYFVAAELTAASGDCDDNDASINPSASEICDGIDNNCNSMTDEGVQTTFYQDLDMDGFGNPAVTQLACTVPMGYVANNTDCNDNSALEKPGQVWYKDTDGDNFAETGAAPLTQCLRPAGYKAASELIATTGDCNDNNAAIYPGAEEICDGLDNDCNGTTDDVAGNTQGNWDDQHVGNSPGSADFPPCAAEPIDTFYIQSYGFGLPNADNRHLVFQSHCGDMSITARILSIQGGGWAGIALQETLSPGSKKAALKSQLNNFILREIRSVTGGNQNLMSLFRPQHVWLKLTRSGNTFTGYTSNNGVTWSMAFSTSIVMGSCIQIGLFAESTNNSTETSVEFDQVNIISQQLNLNFNHDQVQFAGTEIRVADDPHIYPNPVSEILFVNLDHSQIENTYSIQLMDMLGSVILERTAGTGLQLSNQLDMGNLASGMYIVSVKSLDKSVVNYKVVKQ